MCLICQAVEKPFSGGSIAAGAAILQGCDRNFLPAGTSQALLLACARELLGLHFRWLDFFPSPWIGDLQTCHLSFRQSVSCSFRCLFSCLVLVCTEDDYLPSCTESPSLSWLHGSCFTQSEAAKISLALPRRGNRREESSKSQFGVGLGFFVV